MMVKQTMVIMTGWVLVVLFVKNYLMKQTLQKNTWSNTTVMKRTGVLRMMRTKICIPALFVPLILTTLSMQDLTNNSCWRTLLFESMLFEKIVLSHNSIYKLKPLWLWMRNWNSLPSSSLNSIWPGLFWCIFGLGEVWVPILVGNDLPRHDLPYSKGFMKFGCQEPSKKMFDFWNFSPSKRRLTSS